MFVNVWCADGLPLRGNDEVGAIRHNKRTRILDNSYNAEAWQTIKKPKALPVDGQGDG